MVSSDADELILVDSNDRELGYLGKAACHDGDGVLHRAFSLFVLDGDGRVLLQQRAPGKRLWPGYWSNACCSHPRRGETTSGAVERRAREELGIGLQRLEYLYKFEYHARFAHLGSEHELCHVYIGFTRDSPRPNATEVGGWQWYAAHAIDDVLDDAETRCTPWFRLEWTRLRGDFGDRLVPPAGVRGDRARVREPPGS